MSAITRPSEFYTSARLANKKVWDGLNELKSLQKEWDGGDYGSNLPAGSGANDGLVRADLGAVIFDTTNAMDTLLNTGHKTNMAKLL